MKLYQLIAEGPLLRWDGVKKLHSKRVFFSPDHAESYKDEFIVRCTTPINEFDWAVLERVDRVGVVELELEE